jgi:hypothetical protein
MYKTMELSISTTRTTMNLISKLQHADFLSSIELDHLVINDWVEFAPEVLSVAIANYRLDNSNKNAAIMVQIEVDRFKNRNSTYTTYEDMYPK